MSPSKALSRCLALALAAAALPAAAAPVTISNAAYAAAYVRDCRTAAARAAGSSAPDKCEAGTSPDPNVNFSGTFVETGEQLALGGTTASVAATQPIARVGGEATRSFIDASGAAGTLTLKQGAFTGTPYARVSGHSLGLQSFHFTGTTGETRTIGNALDFTHVGTLSPDLAGVFSNPTAYARTRVTVFSLLTPTFTVDSASINTGNTQGAGGVFSGWVDTRADYRLEGEVIDVGILSSPHTSLLNLTMETGRYYFVETYLGLWAMFGGVLDATHTLTTTLGRLDANQSFVADASGFAAAASLPDPVVANVSIGAVPEPGTLAAAGLALGLLAASRRRRAPAC